jgi:hypothetical protein
MTRPLLLDSDALYVAVDRQRRARQISMRRVAAEAGISASALTRLGRGSDLAAFGLIRLLAWLGETDLKPYITEGSK